MYPWYLNPAKILTNLFIVKPIEVSLSHLRQSLFIRSELGVSPINVTFIQLVR